MIETFNGQATIRVQFQSRLEYERFRKYILKTEWGYELDYPIFEELKVAFHSIEDLNRISMRIVELLQMGFQVYCCRYQMETELAEEEHPTEEDHISEPVTISDHDRIGILEDIWNTCIWNEQS